MEDEKGEMMTGRVRKNKDRAKAQPPRPKWRRELREWQQKHWGIAEDLEDSVAEPGSDRPTPKARHYQPGSVMSSKRLEELRHWQQEHWRIHEAEVGPQLNREQLYEMAKRLRIPHRSRMKKAELRAAIRETQ